MAAHTALLILGGIWLASIFALVRVGYRLLGEEEDNDVWIAEHTTAMEADAEERRVREEVAALEELLALPAREHQ